MKSKDWGYIGKGDKTSLILHISSGKKFHKLPKNIYVHKEYPICEECQGKFVPVKSKTICLKCYYGRVPTPPHRPRSLAL